jgi:hypothetical protein
MTAGIYQTLITARTDGSWRAVMEYYGKDGVKHEVIQCNLSAQKDMEEWQEHVSLATSSDSSGYQSTTNTVQNSTQTVRVLLSAIKTVRDTTVASAHHRLKSNDDVIRARSGKPYSNGDYLSLGRRSSRQDESSRRMTMASKTQRACRRSGDGSDQQAETHATSAEVNTTRTNFGVYDPRQDYVHKPRGTSPAE